MHHSSGDDQLLFKYHPKPVAWPPLKANWPCGWDASNINGLRNAGIANGASISNWKDLSANGQGFNDMRDGNKPVFIAGDTPKVDLNNSSMEAYMNTHPSDELTMILSTISKVSVHGIPFFIQTTTHIAMCGLPIMPMAAMEIQA